jgi:hypothetical protein
MANDVHPDETAIDLADESQLAPLRPYRFITWEAEAALRNLAGISRKRPDLFGHLDELSRLGAMFVCHLDLAATKATGQNVLRYHPSDRLMVILAAFMADRHLESVA